MRVKKQKRHRKVVRFYSACFGFREPFNVLCDGTFIHHLLLHRLLPADDALAKLLCGQVTLFSSRCITAELKSLGEPHSESFQASQHLKVARCEHEKRVNAATCVESIVRDGNTNHYFVATQDTELRRKLREIPGVPVIFGLNNALFLEQPSAQQREFVKSSEEERLHISRSEFQMIKKRELKNSSPEQTVPGSAGARDIVRSDVGIEQTARLHTAKGRLDLMDKQKFKRKKAKGPNPLSCKKKRIKESSFITCNQDGGTRESTKRKRNRKRKRSQKVAKLGEEGD
uniref:rRNA-processing protein UTP23 n=1 Tax=Anthurium amnicola TaxID=1678845 RepID=A0A1D1YA84_9ARAE